MASLLVAGGIFIHHKIRDKREAKRDKKRQFYEDRYHELQREHSQHQEKHLAQRTSGPCDIATDNKKRRSTTSLQMGTGDDEDGPTRWVTEAEKERMRS